MTSYANGAPFMVDSATGRILSQEEQAEQVQHLAHSSYLLKCQSFFRLLVRLTYEREIQIVAFKDEVIPMINELIAIPDFVMHLFIERGLLIFLLNLIFDKAKYGTIIGNELRATLTD